MKRILVFAASLLVAAASGQWLEDTIQVPQALVSCYGAGKVYCLPGPPVGLPDSGRVVIVDAAANAYLGCVAIAGGAGPLCFNSQDIKLYCAGSTLTVIDGVTDSVIATVEGAGGWLCYSPVHNKVYCASRGSEPRYDSTVTVVDGASDSVVARVTVGLGPWLMSVDSVGGKVYCANTMDSTVSAIDGSADTVVATIDVGHFCWELCLAGNVRKGYCPDYTGNRLTVVDLAADSVVSRVPLGRRPGDLCYSSASRKLYCAGGSSILVIDCTADSVIATVATGATTVGLLHAPLNNKVYCTTEPQVFADTIYVLDCATDSIIKAIAAGPYLCGSAYFADSNRVFVGASSGGVVHVVRDSVPAAIGEVRPTRLPKGYGTLVRGVIELGGVGAARLLDVSGRRLMDLAPGPNDIRHLSPGIYFIHQPTAASRQLPVVRKVILTR